MLNPLSLLTNMSNVIMVAATITGAFGGFPEPPKAFLHLTQYQIVQWILVFILAYQGGAGGDISFAVISTLVAFVLYKFIRFWERDELDL